MTTGLDEPLIELRPQPGPQTLALATTADISIYGGAAGGGKSWTLLLQPVLHLQVPDFSAVIFRRTFPQIRNPGGLWQESYRVYGPLEGEPKESVLSWDWPEFRSTVRFAHMEHESNVRDWQGAAVPLIEFDELTHFSAGMFYYMLSRNRSTCGVRPYMRGACNPDPDSWLVCDEMTGEWGAGLISWWIDPTSGYPIADRAGVIRWFVREGGELKWADDPAQLGMFTDEMTGDRLPPKSVTFIPANIYDNKLLLAADPGYLANLHALHPIDRDRLLRGNWKIRAQAGKVFNTAWFQLLDGPPGDVIARVRYWDKAGTPDGGKFSVGTRVALTARGQAVIEDVVRGQWGAGDREKHIINTALLDGPNVGVFVEQEPGSSGKESAEATCARLRLRGIPAWADKVTGDKVLRAAPLAGHASAGHVYMLRGPWNREFLAELHGFPDGRFKDQVDSASGGFNRLTRMLIDSSTAESETASPIDDLVASEMGGSFL